MLCCVFTAQVSVYAFDNLPVITISQDSDDEDETSYYTQISSETVVPTHDFSFNNFEKFFSVDEILIVFTEPSILSAAYFIAPVNTFYIKIFGNYIATNAP